jgi:hypothetical protein
MFTFCSVIAVLVCWLCLPCFSLNTPDAKQFVGTWTAQFNGGTFLIVTLTEQGGTLTGTVSRTDIKWDDTGELTQATAQAGEDSIAEPVISGNVLRFISKGSDGQETRRFELELGASPGDAKLQLLTTSAETPSPKPWKLSRTQAAALAAQPAVAPTMKDKLAAAARIWIAGQAGGNTPESGSSSAASGSSAVAAAEAPRALTVSNTELAADLRKAIDGLPRRVNDNANNLGDMVNFVIVGSQEQVQSALQAANWHLADTDSREAALKAVLATYQKKDYLAMPMSRLMLFGRVQDFGYEQAEPYAVVASRHHFRLWKAPFTWEGKTVWVGAGTHDIGFEKDRRNGKITHKIDPAVDGERDNIGRTLQDAGKTQSLTYYLPPEPVQEARNATGGGYHSDGRILVMVLK